MKAMASMTPENNDLIGWMGKNNRAARAARTFVIQKETKSLKQKETDRHFHF